LESVSGKVLGVSDNVNYFLDGLRAASWYLAVIDILLVALLLYFVYIFLRETRAMRILYGLVILIALMLLGRLFNLVLLNWILGFVMAMLVVAIPVVFQPELRAALERLGRSKFLTDFHSATTGGDVVSEVILAAELLSKQKIGALIVIQRKTGLREYTEQGVQIDATISAQLLLSIFFPKSPLHDGAVIVIGNKIVAASTMLPASDITSSSKLGMRHRAGIGITEISDAVAVIVSEETGSISLAVGGEIEKRIATDRLKNRLSALLRSQ
jgi:diadenylate cyclase